MRSLLLRCSFTLCLLASAGTGSAQFDLGFGPPSKATVTPVANVESIQPGVPFFAGIEVQIEPLWHTYWKNTGSPTGIPTSIDWELPDGFVAGELIFPTPHYEVSQGAPSHVFSGTVYHVAKITPPDNLEPGSEVELRGSVNLLVCDANRCENPKPRELSLTLPVAAAAPPASEHAGGIEAMLDDSPLRLPKWEARAVLEGDTVVLTAALPDGVSLPAEGLYFFANENGLLEPGKEAQSFEQAGRELTIRIKKGEGAFAGSLPGILASDGPIAGIDSRSVVINTVGGSLPRPPSDSVPDRPKEPIAEKPQGVDLDSLTEEDKAEIRAAIKEMASWVEEVQRPILLMLLFAFLGGIILNLMPCVFPVLGIKIMGFVAQAGEDKSKIRKHGLVFAAGVVLSLWVLVTALLILKYTGEKVGWGFQLQDPTFLAVMILVLFAFGLNLSGLFEIGSSLTGAGANLQQKHGYAGSFFSGVLAVLVATPCTGPFMGPAIGFALTSSAVQTFAIFTALGIGLALPYVVLSFFPVLIQKLPKPGPWMTTFKQFMAFPLYFTVVWLIGVFGKVTGITPIFYLLLGLATLAFGLWIYGRYATSFTKSKSRTFARFATVGVGALAGWFAFHAISLKPDGGGDGKMEKHGIAWQGFDPREIVQARKKGRTIFIDFTADW